MMSSPEPRLECSDLQVSHGFINGQPPTADRGRLTLILILLTDTYFM